ncbi:MAG TPA: DUF4836 family protein [Hanamia sp.]|nr:DUF4836 family protein [Hanamia sp.]
MKSFLRLSILISVFALLFSSCGKKNEVGKMIPNDAHFVAQINIKSLGNKLSWNDIKQTNWYKKIYADSSMNDWKRKVLDNPSTTGIDFEDGLVFFVSQNAGTDYFAAEGKIKSEKDFEEFNKNADPSQAAKKEGDFNVLVLKNNHVVVWNDDRFVYLMNMRGTPTEMLQQHDSTQMQQNEPTDKSAKLSAIGKNLFNLKSDSSLAKNDHFGSLMNESGDVHVWQNTEAIIKSSSSLGMLGMLKLDAFTKDNVSTYTINFDNGKIDVDQKTYASKELTDIVKKYTGSSINGDMIKNIPSQDVDGLLAFNFKPEGIVELIKLTGADGMINTYAQQMGFTLDDFSKATNGDYLLAFTDFKFKDSLRRPDFNYLFSAGIADKASLQKILDAVKKTTSQMGKDSVANYVMNDKTIAFASNNSFATQYLNGNNNKFDFTEKFSGHPVGFYLDIHKILSQFSTLSSDSDHKAMLDQSLNTWNNIISYGGEFNDNAFKFHSEINLINKDSNSLKQLNHYLDQMSLYHESKKDKSTKRLDSLLVPPPIDTVKVK